MSFDSRKIKRKILSDLKQKAKENNIEVSNSQLELLSNVLVKKHNKQNKYFNTLMDFFDSKPIRLISRIKTEDNKVIEKSLIIDLMTDKYYSDNKDIECFNVVNRRLVEDESIVEYDIFSFLEMSISSIEEYALTKHRKIIDMNKYENDIDYCQEINKFIFTDFILDYENDFLKKFKPLYKFRMQYLNSLKNKKEEV